MNQLYLQKSDVLDHQNNCDFIKNISLVGAQGSGKTTLLQQILESYKNIENETIEQTFCLNVSSLISINNKTMVSIIDTPGHYDFVAEVESALRLTDGAIFVIDARFGVTMYDQILFKYLSQEKIKPILLINKIDLLIEEMGEDQQGIFLRLKSIINDMNIQLNTFMNDSVQDYIFSPSVGNVIFASISQRWAFSLTQLSRFYNQILQINSNQIAFQLWNHNEENNNISNDGKDNERLENINFINQVLSPLIQYQQKIKNKIEFNLEDLFLDSIKNICKNQRLQDEKNQISNAIDEKIVPVKDCLLEIIQEFLPSPYQSMQYRSIYFYQGSLEDEIGQAMRFSSSKGHLMMQSVKLVQLNNEMYALCRVFCGTLTKQQNLRILNPHYTQGSKENLFKSSVLEIKLPNDKTETIEAAYAGQIIYVKFEGKQTIFQKYSTIATSKIVNILNVVRQQLPLVKSIIRPVNKEDLPILFENLQMISLIDSAAQFVIEHDLGQGSICSPGFVHAEYCLKILQQKFDRQFTHDLLLFYKESIQKQNSETCLTKTPYRLNRIYGSCEKIDQEYIDLIDSNFNDFNNWSKSERQDFLSKQFDIDWDCKDKNYWCFSPQFPDGSNIFANKLQNSSYLTENIFNSMHQGFKWAVQEGILCQQPTRGIQFNLEDIFIKNNDKLTIGQIFPTIRRLFLACQYKSEPQLLQPMCLSEIKILKQLDSTIYDKFMCKDITIFDLIEENNYVIIKLSHPLSQQNSVEEIVKSCTPSIFSSQFTTWDVIKGDALDSSSQSGQIVEQIRNAKGLGPRADVSYYCDKF